MKGFAARDYEDVLQVRPEPLQVFMRASAHLLNSGISALFLYSTGYSLSPTIPTSADFSLQHSNSTPSPNSACTPTTRCTTSIKLLLNTVAWFGGLLRRYVLLSRLRTHQRRPRPRGDERPKHRRRVVPGHQHQPKYRKKRGTRAPSPSHASNTTHSVTIQPQFVVMVLLKTILLCGCVRTWFFFVYTSSSSHASTEWAWTPYNQDSLQAHQQDSDSDQADDDTQNYQLSSASYWQQHPNCAQKGQNCSIWGSVSTCSRPISPLSHGGRRPKSNWAVIFFGRTCIRKMAVYLFFLHQITPPQAVLKAGIFTGYQTVFHYHYFYIKIIMKIFDQHPKNQGGKCMSLRSNAVLM